MILLEPKNGGLPIPYYVHQDDIGNFLGLIALSYFRNGLEKYLENKFSEARVLWYKTTRALSRLSLLAEILTFKTFEIEGDREGMEVSVDNGIFELLCVSDLRKTELPQEWEIKLFGEMLALAKISGIKPYLLQAATAFQICVWSKGQLISELPKYSNGLQERKKAVIKITELLREEK